MTQQPLHCSSEGCERPAVEALALRDQPGHVHDCAEHAHDVREWCDVVASAPLTDGCPWPCTGNAYIWFGQPAPLDPEDPR